MRKGEEILLKHRTLQRKISKLSGIRESNIKKMIRSDSTEIDTKVRIYDAFIEAKKIYKLPEKFTYQTLFQECNTKN